MNTLYISLSLTKSFSRWKPLKNLRTFPIDNGFLSNIVAMTWKNIMMRNTTVLLSLMQHYVLNNKGRTEYTGKKKHSMHITTKVLPFWVFISHARL